MKCIIKSEGDATKYKIVNKKTTEGKFGVDKTLTGIGNMRESCAIWKGGNTFVYDESAELIETNLEGEFNNDVLISGTVKLYRQTTGVYARGTFDDKRRLNGKNCILQDMEGKFVAKSKGDHFAGDFEPDETNPFTMRFGTFADNKLISGQKTIKTGNENLPGAFSVVVLEGTFDEDEQLSGES